MNVQAGVDGDARFRYVSISCAGATHDALAFNTCGLKRELDKGSLPDRYFIVGDAAYSGCSAQILTPFDGKNLAKNKDTFNFYQSSLRSAPAGAFRAQNVCVCCVRVSVGWAGRQQNAGAHAR